MNELTTDMLFPNKPLARRPVWEWVFSIIFRKLKDGQLTLHLPGGRSRTYGVPGKVHVEMTLRDGKAVSRMIRGGGLGFAEGYMAGEWSTPNLPELLKFLAYQQESLEAKLPKMLRAARFEELRNLGRKNSLSGSKKNIEFHYDLGNNFYKLWLDATMTYSAALFSSKNLPLADAQTAKYKRLAAQLNIQPGDTILEIGCGWGGFAEYVTSAYDCHITGLTLSHEQLAFADKRLKASGQSERADFLLQDYRDTEGQFNHIVSIEMFEAVGEEYWPAYFDKVKELLAPGGRAALQVITIDHKNFDYYKSRVDFIQKYIFPGGILPSVPVLDTQFERAGLTKTDEFMFGHDYAETLRRWRTEFHRHAHDVKALGYDGKFMRMWDYYLAYCEAGFENGMIDVGHFILE